MKDLIEATAWHAGSWWAERLDATYGGKREELSKAIMRRVDAALRRDGSAFLENDYDPKCELLAAVLEVGIECRGMFFSGDGIFPRKHTLHITPGKLEPKEGYGNWTGPILVLEVFPEDGSQTRPTSDGEGKSEGLMPTEPNTSESPQPEDEGAAG